VKPKPEKQLEHMLAARIHAQNCGLMSKASASNLVDCIKKNKTSYSDMLLQQSQELQDVDVTQEEAEAETSFAAKAYSYISSPSANLNSSASSVSPAPSTSNPVKASKAQVEIDTALIKKLSGEMKTDSNLTITMYDYGGQEVFYSILFYSITWYSSRYYHYRYLVPSILCFLHEMVSTWFASI
jgi:hypothetical protein